MPGLYWVIIALLVLLADCLIYLLMPRRSVLKVSFAWYDLWMGVYWDRRERALYICPLPTIVIRLGR